MCARSCVFHVKHGSDSAAQKRCCSFSDTQVTCIVSYAARVTCSGHRVGCSFMWTTGFPGHWIKEHTHTTRCQVLSSNAASFTLPEQDTPVLAAPARSPTLMRLQLSVAAILVVQSRFALLINMRVVPCQFICKSEKSRLLSSWLVFSPVCNNWKISSMCSTCILCI